MNEPALRPKAYLGDGAYATFDGFQIWVHAERDGMVHQVALERDTFEALVSFAKRFSFPTTGG